MEDGILESWVETETQAFKLVNTKTKKNKTCHKDTEQEKKKFRLLAELPGEKLVDTGICCH